MKVKKNANGKTTVKISHQEWVQIGKEAGFWDNVKQVGKGVGQGIKGIWNTGAGIAGILGDAYKGLSNGIQQLRSKIQQGQVSAQEVGQYKQMIAGMQNDLAAANSELAAIDQQTAQTEQTPPGISQNPIYNRAIASAEPIKLKKLANGKATIKISESKWQQIGVKNGWIEEQ